MSERDHNKNWKESIIRGVGQEEEEELKKVFNNYKKGDYSFGRFETEYDLIQAFLRGKIFVLEGSNVGIFLSILFASIFLFFIFFTLFIGDIPYLPLVFSIIFSIIEIGLIVFAINIKMRFAVVGPFGVYYRRHAKKNFFLWKDVAPTIETKTVRLRYGMTTNVTVITIITPSNKKIRFLHGQYKKKEFPSLVKEEMFYLLFYIYSEFGKRNKT
jgi:hypothetical protein